MTLYRNIPGIVSPRTLGNNFWYLLNVNLKGYDPQGLRLSVGHKRSYSTEEDTESDTGNYISVRPVCSK